MRGSVVCRDIPLLRLDGTKYVAGGQLNTCLCVQGNNASGLSVQNDVGFIGFYLSELLVNVYGLARPYKPFQDHQLGERSTWVR